MATNKDNTKRIMVVLVGFLFILTYFLVNTAEYGWAFLTYVVFGGLSVFFYVFWAKISKSGDLEGLSKDWVRNALIGVGLGIATIILGQVVGFVGAIGIPSVPQSIVSTVARFIIIVPSAMILESTFFLDFLMDFLQSKLGIPKVPSLAIMAVFASLFHLTAYGGNLAAAGGSFFSAFLMFFLFGALAEYQNDLAGAITWHGTLNFYLGFFKLNIIITPFMALLA